MLSSAHKERDRFSFASVEVNVILKESNNLDNSVQSSANMKSPQNL